MRPELDVSRLVDRLAAGDERALTEFYEARGERLYQLAFSLTASSADAKDVVQDVFIALPERVKSFNGRGSFDRWLQKVTVRTALMRLRANRQRREAPLMHMQRTPPPPVVDKIWLERALAGLRECYRIPLLLKEVCGFSHCEIGEILGISVSASQTRVYRARVQLREMLER